MKNLFLTLALIVIGFIASAQPAQIADTIARKGLPILRSYVAPDVVQRAVRKYGRSLYCIEKALAPDCENSYLVGLLRDGKSLQMEFMCDNLRMVKSGPVWQAESIVSAGMVSNGRNVVAVGLQH